jgi:hypothetical protein
MSAFRWHTTGWLLIGLLFAVPVAAQFPVGSEFRVDTGGAPPAATGTARARLMADDSFIVTWVTQPAPGDSDVMARRFDPLGVPIGAEFRVNSFTTGAQYSQSIGSDATGNFVVVWTSAGQIGAEQDVFGQRFTPSGSPLGGEFLVNTYTTYGQGYPSVAVRSNGEFVVI